MLREIYQMTFEPRGKKMQRIAQQAVEQSHEDFGRMIEGGERIRAGESNIEREMLRSLHNDYIKLAGRVTQLEGELRGFYVGIGILFFIGIVSVIIAAITQGG